MHFPSFDRQIGPVKASGGVISRPCLETEAGPRFETGGVGSSPWRSESILRCCQQTLSRD